MVSEMEHNVEAVSKMSEVQRARAYLGDQVRHGMLTTTVARVSRR